MSNAMGVDIEFLRGYLEDEFSSTPDARVRIVLPSTTTRSIDLDQDYDPESSNLHTLRGVRVSLRSREYFFPAAWAREMKRVYEQVEEMREFLGER